MKTQWSVRRKVALLLILTIPAVVVTAASWMPREQGQITLALLNYATYVVAVIALLRT